jgi:hypothetical protein
LFLKIITNLLLQSSNIHIILNKVYSLIAKIRLKNNTSRKKIIYFIKNQFSFILISGLQRSPSRLSVAKAEKKQRKQKKIEKLIISLFIC